MSSLVVDVLWLCAEEEVDPFRWSFNLLRTVLLESGLNSISFFILTANSPSSHYPLRAYFHTCLCVGMWIFDWSIFHFQAEKLIDWEWRAGATCSLASYACIRPLECMLGIEEAAEEFGWWKASHLTSCCSPEQWWPPPSHSSLTNHLNHILWVRWSFIKNFLGSIDNMNTNLKWVSQMPLYKPSYSCL